VCITEQWQVKCVTGAEGVGGRREKKKKGEGVGEEMLCERIRRERGITSTSRSDKLNAARINREGATES